jgi:hypothetical protein
MAPESVLARLKDLRSGLLRLHSILLSSERAVYERDIEKIRSQSHFLDLLLNDAAFAWLRELSQFIVLIDEAMEADHGPDPLEAERFLARARAMLSPGEGGGVFEKRYLETLQRDPDVVVAHSAVVRLLRPPE